MPKMTGMSSSYFRTGAWHVGAIHEVKHRDYVGIEQFSGEGCSTIAPNDSLSLGAFVFVGRRSPLIRQDTIPVPFKGRSTASST
jgi:hypothetical protein